MKIRDFFKFSPLRLNEDGIDVVLKGKQDKLLTFPPPRPVLDKANLIGIEVEVERVPIYVDFLSPLWKRTEDSSLRNDGWEYISSPIKGVVIEHGLRLLMAELKHYNPDMEFSGRCSTHVHVNARTMEIPQAVAMMYLYLVFEKTLFDFVGHDRINNHHCVPLRRCDMTETFQNILEGRTPLGTWHKYTAVNLLPLSGNGTIEFRHMHGTSDVEKILDWIDLLTRLKLFCYKRTYDEVINSITELNTNSEFQGFAAQVFGPQVKLLNVTKEDMEEGVSLVKLYSAGNSYLEKLGAELRGNPANRLRGASKVTLNPLTEFLNVPVQQMQVDVEVMTEAMPLQL